MVINKYYVFIAQELNESEKQEQQSLTEQELHRQELLKNAQQQGGLAH